jgi:hypothetical protein
VEMQKSQETYRFQENTKKTVIYEVLSLEIISLDMKKDYNKHDHSKAICKCSDKPSGSVTKR